MNKTEAQLSVKNLASELFSLNPTALITLFEIDISQIGFDMGIISQSEVDQEKSTKFRLHNNVNLTSSSIFWQGKEYTAAPIIAEGFEVSLRGVIPTPKLSMTVSDEGIPLLAQFKDRLFSMGDIVGAKVTRIRTFSRFLDAENFVGNTPPANFYPDPNSELPRDIYFIDRKSQENKNLIEYELSPLFEVENIKLPGRTMIANTCVGIYRGGDGCCYEYASRKTDIHGDAILPQNAPPVANEHNELINTLITGVSFTDLGAYNLNQIYSKGQFVYIQNRGIKYYFVSKIDNNNTQPPNIETWMEDKCSKSVLGCRLRWGQIADGNLPFVGFPACIRSK